LFFKGDEAIMRWLFISYCEVFEAHDGFIRI